MLPVSGYQDFINKFHQVKDRSRLYVFILFDDRPSHHAIQKFVDESFGWLDSLAAAANMFGFAFLHREENTGNVVNPSLKVASLFGIRPNQLPGVVVFTMLPDSESISEAIFLPLKARLFSEDISVVEEVFADLFALFQEAQATTITREELLAELRDKISSLNRRQILRPIVTFLGERLVSLAKLPDKLLEAMAGAFGEGLAKGIAG